MYININHNSGVPISEQIIDQIKYLAVSGALEGNQKIPSVRGLASQLKLNPTTVARVYRQLEAEEIIFTQRGKGTFIAQSSDDRHAAACSAAAEYLDRAAGQLHYSPEECLQIVQRMLDQRAAD